MDNNVKRIAQVIANVRDLSNYPNLRLQRTVYGTLADKIEGWELCTDEAAAVIEELKIRPLDTVL